jgi:hypothetical protein
MKTLSLTLIAAAVSTLAIVPAQAEENVVTTQSAYEYSYQHELNQGDLSGDRLMQRDRVQDRLKTSAEDGSKIQDQLNRQDQDRVRSELKTNNEARNSVQMMNTNRMQNSFSHSVGAAKAGGGGRR